MPDVREYIPTPEVAKYHSHLHEIVGYIPPLDPESNILLLIGRTSSRPTMSMTNVSALEILHMLQHAV